MLTNLLFIITGFLGVLTIVIILTSYKLNRMMNFHLIIIFILISIRFLLNGFCHFGYLDFLKEYYVNYSKFLIVIIPSFYLYFKNLITNNKEFKQTDLLHFIFPITFLLSNIYIVNYKAFNAVSFYFTFYLIFFLYNLTYCFLAFFTLKNNVWKKKDNDRVNNKQNRIISNWTLFLFVLLMINLTRLFIALYLEDNYYHAFVFGERLQWMAAIIWMSIFFKILITPEILYGYHILDNKIKNLKINDLALDTDWDVEGNQDLNNIQDSKLKEKVAENIILYISKIDETALEFRLFKDSKFSIYDLAIKLNIPNSHLNYLFKYHSKISFSDYKKKIRIQHSIRLIESDYLKTNTLDSLAKEVGFASYNPFFTSFKSITGISPHKYIVQLNEI